MIKLIFFLLILFIFLFFCKEIIDNFKPIFISYNITVIKKLLLIFSFLLCLQAGAQSLNGKWKGSLQAGPVKLTLVLNIDESEKNVTWDVIEQGAEKIPMTVKVLGNDSVNVSIPSLALNYAGKLNGGEINGVFTQQGFSAPLDFKRGDVVSIRPPAAETPCIAPPLPCCPKLSASEYPYS